MTTRIEFIGLRAGHRRRTVVTVDSLALESASAVLLEGRNGAGKSTLLRVMAGLLAPLAGQVRIDHGPPLAWPLAARALRARVVYVDQQPWMLDRSVAANIDYGLRHRGVARAERRQRVAEALAWSGLESVAERNARTLSGGERQRVALARARVLSPALLLLDEPTANLDREARERTRFLIRRVLSEGTGLVVTSHEGNIGADLDGRHVAIDAGRINDHGTWRREPAADSARSAGGGR